MDNKMVMNELKKIPVLNVFKHKKNELYNAEIITRKPYQRRKNVVGDITPTGNSFKLYNLDERKWVPYRKLKIENIDDLIEWVKRDIELLSK